MKLGLTIGKRLSFSIGGMLLISAWLGWSSSCAIIHMKSVLATTIGKTAPKLELFGTINAAKSDMAVAQRDVLINAMAVNPRGVEAAKTAFAPLPDRTLRLVRSGSSKRLPSTLPSLKLSIAQMKSYMCWSRTINPL